MNYFNNYSKIPSLSRRLLILTLIESIGSGLGFYISIYFSSFLNFSVLTIGKILSFYGVGTIVGGGIGGQMVDKISASFTSIMSLFLFALSFILLACFKSSNQLMIIMFIMGMANYGFNASNSVLLLRTAGEDMEVKLRLLNLKSVISNIGMCSAAISLSFYGNHDFYYIFSLVALLLVFASFYQYKNYDFYEKIYQKELPSLQEKCNPVYSKNILYITLICLFLVGFIVAQHKIAYPIFVKSCFKSSYIISFIFSLNPLMVIFFQPPIGNFVGKFNKILMMGIGSLGLGLGMVILSISNSVLIFTISVILYTLGEMIFFSLSQLLCYQSVDENNKGKAIGFWRVTYSLSHIISPMVGSFMYVAASAKMVWLICGFLGILCLLMTNYLNFLEKIKVEHQYV